jgi:hypothetical protein
MSTVIMDGRVRVTWCTAISNIAAPTTTELNAGTALEGYITPDGLDIAMDTGGVDNSNLGSTFTTMKAGRKKPGITVIAHHDSPTDTAYNLIGVYRASGYLVVRRGVDKTTAWTSTDKVEVYPVECGEPLQVKPAPDSVWDFQAPMFVTSDPNTHAVVA